MMEMGELIDHFDSLFDEGILDEIGFMMTKDPPHVVKIDKNLGISMSVLKTLFRYCIVEFERVTGPYHSNLAFLSGVDMKAMKSLSRLLLVVKGDFPSAFKYRKMLIESELLSIAEELYFTSVLFTKHPKSPSGWYHRRWCLLRNLSTKNYSTLSACEIETEKQLCSTMTERSPKNYYAWMHRLWLLNHMSTAQLEDELSFTKDWLWTHVSDHSACNHRNQVVQRLLSNPQTLSSNPLLTSREFPSSFVACNSGSSMVMTFLRTLLDESAVLAIERPGHEALWCHRRTLATILMKQVKLCKDGRSWGKYQARSVSLLSLDVLQSPVSSTDGSDTWALYLLQFINNSESLCEGDCFAKWMLEWLRSEAALCRRAVGEDGRWDCAPQRRMALRYWAFLLETVRTHCSCIPPLDCMFYDLLHRLCCPSTLEGAQRQPMRSEVTCQAGLYRIHSHYFVSALQRCCS